MIKLLCKILFTPDNSNHPIEIFGQIDKLQLNSQNCEWITLESKYYLNNRLHCKESIINKQDIIKIVIYQEKKRYVIDKESLALNTHVLSFIGVKT
ncbi:hypothetical protein ES703_52834 [subsurface metagenome]